MTQLTAIEIAKLTAQIEGGGFKRSATKAKAIEKFCATLASVGRGDEAQRVLAAGTHAEASQLLASPPKKARPGRRTKAAGRRLKVAGGYDADNPYRPGSKSHAAFEFVRENPLVSYEDCKAAGIRMRAITAAISAGTIIARVGI